MAADREIPRLFGRLATPFLDYEKTYDTFLWEQIRRELDGLPGARGLNSAHEAVDRHANGPRRDHLAIRWLGKDGTVLDFTYGERDPDGYYWFLGCADDIKTAGHIVGPFEGESALMEFGIEIPEADYEKLATVTDIVSYLSARVS